MNRRNDEEKGRRAKGRNREAIRQYDGNTEDAEVWRGRVLLFRGLGAPTDVRASSRTHTRQRIAQTPRVVHLILRGCHASMSLILLRTQ